MRTITAPGVEIKERDLSQYNPGLAGTTALAIGFADKGEDMLPLEFTSRNSWLSYFGVPSNEAERYFYYASMEVINQNGSLIAAKLPYDNDVANIYQKTVYTVATSAAFTDTLSAITAEDSSYTGASIITVGNITSLATSALDNYRTASARPTANTFEIIDITRQKLTKDLDNDSSIGTFAIVSTATNALAVQQILENIDITDFNAVSSASTSAGINILSGDVAVQFASSTITDSTLSKQISELFPAIVYNDQGGLDNEYMHQIMVTVVKMYVDSNYGNKINFIIQESFLGSLNRAAINPDTNESIFIDNIINGNSNYIEFYSNVSTNLPASNSIYHIANQKTGIFGFTETQAAKDMSLATMSQSLNTVFDRLNNIDETEIDIIIDAGLSNIASYIDAVSGDGEVVYDPTINVSNWTLSSRDDTLTWRSIASQLINFAQNTRKDCITIIDGLRPLVIEGNQKIIRTSAPNNTIDLNILNKVKFTTGLNSSYGAGYMDWFSQLDEFSGMNFWCPPSIKAAGIYIYTDRIANYWDAPAGLNRGIVYSANDIAFNPNQKQAGSIYTKGWNYAVNYPYDGIVLEGQKTLQTKPSAFDRVNVRRLFLRLERQVYKLARYFVYEPNTFVTRNRLKDQIVSILEDVKIRNGIYDYRVICDEQNNTPDVIDRNELKCAIMIKPVKSAEFILIDFIALRTGGSFAEVVL